MNQANMSERNQQFVNIPFIIFFSIEDSNSEGLQGRILVPSFWFLKLFMFTCSLTYFVVVPLFPSVKISHVPMFPKTPGRNSIVSPTKGGLIKWNERMLDDRQKKLMKDLLFVVCLSNMAAKT